MICYTHRQTSGLPVSSHTFPEFSVHLLGVTPAAAWLEYLEHAGPILTQRARVEGGMAYPPDRPGPAPAWSGMNLL